MRVPEVAEYLQVSRSTIYNLMDRGELSYVKIGASRRVPRRAVEELAERGYVGAEVEA